MSVSIISRIDRKENQSQLSSFKTIRYNSQRVLKPLPTSNLGYFTDQQITDQLVSQLTVISQIIGSYQLKIEEEGANWRRKDPIEEIINLHEVIVDKNDQIKAINQEIKNLKLANRSQQQLGSKLISSSPNLFQLAQELRRQRKQLCQVIEEHQMQVTKYRNMKGSIQDLQRIYLQKFKDRTISYEKFREKCQDNQRYKNKLEKESKNRSKEKLESTLEYLMTPKLQSQTKSLKQIQTKKTNAKIWIKKFKKKHEKKISQLNAQLQFLRDEDALLSEQIKEVESEKMHLEARFSLNRRKNGNYGWRKMKAPPSYLKHFQS